MSSTPLVRRKQLLALLGVEEPVPRWSWSHDLGESIAFDAWEHNWQRDTNGNFASYPLRTNGPNYNLSQSRSNPRLGHTRWQQHVDLVLARKRMPLAIVPVGNKPGTYPNKGAQGWLSLYVEGHLTCG